MLDTTEIIKESTTEISRTLRENMVFIHAGSYMMGSDKFYPEEKPVNKCPDTFWMDKCPLTNKAFSDFVASTNCQLIM